MQLFECGRLYSNFELHYIICYDNVWNNGYHWIIAILKFKGNEYYKLMTSGFDRKYSSTLYYVVCCHVSVLFACLYSNHRLSHWLHALSSTLCTTSNANVYFHTTYLFANKIVRKYHSQKNGHGCCFTSVIILKL